MRGASLNQSALATRSPLVASDACWRNSRRDGITYLFENEITEKTNRISVQGKSSCFRTCQNNWISIVPRTIRPIQGCPDQGCFIVQDYPHRNFFNQVLHAVIV